LIFINLFSTKTGSQNVHLNLPPHKAVLLAGPHGSGKELLVHIACNELGGLLLDLSPANLAKSYKTGK
jgi:fatty acid synthase